MTYPLVQKLGYNKMSEWGDNVLLGKKIDADAGDTHTSICLSHLKEVTLNLPGKATPITLEEYIKEIKSLRESTYSRT